MSPKTYKMSPWGVVWEISELRPMTITEGEEMNHVIDIQNDIANQQFWVSRASQRFKNISDHCMYLNWSSGSVPSRTWFMIWLLNLMVHPTSWVVRNIWVYFGTLYLPSLRILGAIWTVPAHGVASLPWGESETAHCVCWLSMMDCSVFPGWYSSFSELFRTIWTFASQEVGHLMRRCNESLEVHSHRALSSSHLMGALQRRVSRLDWQLGLNQTLPRLLSYPQSSLLTLCPIHR